MKCNVIFYQNKADSRVVDKTRYITMYNKILRGNFRDEVDLLKPTFTIESINVPMFNYCYIEDFQRYYFINDIRLIRNNVYSISCSVDVLMTYKEFINTSSQYVSRQENEYNELLQDTYVTFSEDYSFTIKEQHLDFLDYANISDSDSGYNDLTNILLSTTANGTNFEV